MREAGLSDRGLPRARGDRPEQPYVVGTAIPASPCPRGSTLSRFPPERSSGGFPVPAGIDPISSRSVSMMSRLPRARGDRPCESIHCSTSPRASPCPRGSTLFPSSAMGGSKGFPVPAGIDPYEPEPLGGSLRLPRARGDRPFTNLGTFLNTAASPCPRGSTCEHPHPRSDAVGFPVPAGIDPPRGHRPAPRRGLPRARGDRPKWPLRSTRMRVASPCPRGSTQGGGAALRERSGFPVPAGIDPSPSARDPPPPWLPRARGDRP